MNQVYQSYIYEFLKQILFYSPFVPLFNKALILRYKKALEKALRISTIHNISPIPGMTVIIIQINEVESMAFLSKSISPAKRNVSFSNISHLLYILYFVKKFSRKF